jgi:hypothetical protein
MRIPYSDDFPTIIGSIILCNSLMASLGITTLRFSNEEVMHNIEGIHQHLTQYLNTVLPPLTPPWKGGEYESFPFPGGD